ncbi:MAG: CAP domain-containing protein [Dehalococcoidia bacterium]
MTGRVPWVAFFGVTALGLAVASRGMGSPAGAATNCDTSTGDMDSVEMQVLSLVNAERERTGMLALLASPGLSRAAAWKSEDQQSMQSHTDSLGRGPGKRASACGYPSASAAENIAWGYPTAASVVGAWMSSAGHRANILHTGYVVAGVGYSGGAWTLDFGTVNDTGGEPPPPPPSTATATPTVPPVLPATSTPAPKPTPPATQPQPAPVEAQAVLDLQPGLNLVTYAGAELPVGRGMEPLGGKVIEVFRWNVQTGAWETWRPGESSAFMLTPGEAYFLVMGVAASWSH